MNSKVTGYTYRGWIRLIRTIKLNIRWGKQKIVYSAITSFVFVFFMGCFFQYVKLRQAHSNGPNRK